MPDTTETKQILISLLAWLCWLIFLPVIVPVSAVIVMIVSFYQILFKDEELIFPWQVEWKKALGIVED
jgi:hypothetical protein